MDKAYSPGEIESRIYARWESSGAFAPRTGEPGEAQAPVDRPAYCIMLPPPNVTGTLHMGHAFQHTLMDTLTRWHRMRGDTTLWQPGTDHAGIATQMVVERQLAASGKHRLDLGREAFIERVWRWKAESGSTITRQMRRLGASVDWSRDKFTMDPDLSRAVTEAFVRLHEDGLIYRGKRLVNWDPVLLTAVSDLEVLSEEEQGSLWHIRYPIAGGGSGDAGHIVVATTRPETLLGDTAVAVNPEDERYRSLVGRQLDLPLTGRTIPVIADSYVDAAFGSGCVKITPAHDFNDYEMGLRHGLPQINIFTPTASLNENAPERFRGLDRFEARKRIVAELEELGLIEKIEPHKLKVPRGDRTNAVIEPYLTDQWYVKIAPLAEPALKAVEDGRTKFVPENWAKTYYEWMRNIKDWCISRQLWWGHRIPAWYDETGGIYVGRDEAEVRKKHTLGERKLTQDADVLDTWFSSALWPFSTLGWPHETPELKRFYPTSVLVTGFDIIFFWVARMMMMGLKFTGDVPFKHVYITGLIRDENGEKMSKAKGNIIDPIDLIDGIDLPSLVTKRTSGMMQPHLKDKIEKATRKQFPEGIAPYGTDALRFTFASLAGPARDINFDLGRVGGYRNFCNKLWNAARFVLLTVEGQGELVGDAEPSVADRWIVSRFAATLSQVDGALNEYRFDFAATALYEFTWYEFCDWYLELTKPVLQGENSTEAQKRGTRRTLVVLLEALLRALHPVMPFITEEIWQRVRPVAEPLIAAGHVRGARTRADSIMLTAYPAATDYARDAQAETQVGTMKEYILKLRQIRGEMNIAPSRRIPLLLRDADAQARLLVGEHLHYLQRLAGLESVKLLAAGEAEPISASAMVANTSLLVPMAGLIDAAAEVDRVTKVIRKNESDIGKLRGKLGNESFLKNAKPELVEADRAKLAELEAQNEALARQLDRVRRLGGT
jgi:valyl-tRNA synthetase